VNWKKYNFMRIVIKIGTNVVVNPKGLLDTDRLSDIASDVAQLHKNGHEVVLVTSGAVAVGKIQAPQIKSQFRKVLAAIGQPVLMRSYEKSFQSLGLQIGQCLLSKSDFFSREMYDNAVVSLMAFFQAGVIPVVNENDVVAAPSLNFGDNDALAAMLAIAVKADVLLLLTDQPGLLSGDPKKDKDAKLISVVTRVDKEIERLCSKTMSESGRGGMISKVKAAQQAIFAGVTTFIADGRQPHIITDILEDGKIIGTRFIACQSQLNDQKRWLMASKGFGQVIIDSGAVSALRKGKSLLMPGVLAIKGFFEPGSIVEVAGEGNTISYGKINYDDKDLQKALLLKKKGLPTSGLIKKEVIHCDYMIVLKS
jgi:glutamate 5-kinase